MSPPRHPSHPDCRCRLTQIVARYELDTNAYSVPWKLIGETVQVVVASGRVSIRHRGAEIAAHAESTGRRQRVVDPTHLAGIARPRPSAPAEAAGGQPVGGLEPAACELLRPLSEYERAAGGGW